MRPRGKTLAFVLLAVAPVAFTLLVPLPARWHGPWQSKFLDLGHVPLFCCLTICLWLAMGRHWLWPPLLAVTVAGLGEILQALTSRWFHRTGDLGDFVRGVLGVAAAVVLLRLQEGPRTIVRVAGHALVVLCLVAWPILEVAPRLLDAWEGYWAFPVLADFATRRQLLRWEDSRQALLTRLPDPTQPNRWSGRIEFLPGADDSTAELQPILHDWSAYRWLCCSFALAGEPLRVGFSLRCTNATGQTSHYDTEKVYEAGEHLLRLDLTRAARESQDRPMHLGNARYFLIFSDSPDRPRVLRLHSVWLE